MTELIGIVTDLVNSAGNAAEHVDQDEVIDVLTTALLAETAEIHLWEHSQDFERFRKLDDGSLTPFGKSYGWWMSQWAGGFATEAEFNEWYDLGPTRDLPDLMDIVNRDPISAFDNAVNWKQNLRDVIKQDVAEPEGGWYTF
ncbi:MAG: hypothetical protein RDV48_21230 [Candidatus Eremiobacteraeota bacterium]|nr:hypothetical protein [Candidatus Eremiobacteraeota bacterium]